MKVPELLSPVGSFECLKAAVQNGADSVYFGSSSFNARANANNFDSISLKEAITYAKLRNVKTNLTLNTLIKNQELKKAISIAKEAYELGIDAIIVQDLGLANFLIHEFPDLPIHASTQMTAHNLEDVLFLQKLGFQRIVLSRELSLEEIDVIVKHSTVETECFIHGALCISYSGRCLFSSMIGARSGNRGKCAQPCRLPYELFDESSNCAGKGYLLSPRDLCGLDVLPELISMGVTCFKIEGRLKGPEYVATVTRIYRHAIDHILQNQSSTISPATIKELKQVFNRGGFSKGHFTIDSNLIYKEKPNHQGISLGTIVSYQPKKGYITLKLTDSLEKGDSVAIENESGSYFVSELMKNGKNIDFAEAGQTIEFGRAKGKILVGDHVYKLSSKKLTQIAQDSYQTGKEYRKIKLSASISIHKNQPVCLTLKTTQEEGDTVFQNTVPITTDIFPEESQNRPLTKETFLTQFRKTGNSLYEFETVSIDLEPNLFLKISDMNKIRRQALETIHEIRINSIGRTAKEVLLPIAPSYPFHKETKTALLLNTLSQKKDYMKLHQVDNLYIPFHYFIKPDFQSVLGTLCNNFSVYLYMPSITQKNYTTLLVNKLDKITNSFSLKGFVLSSLGQLSYVTKYAKKIIANYTLNLFNSLTSYVIEKSGFHCVTLSPELNKKELFDLSTHLAKKQECELIVYGRLPLMTSHHCFIGTSNICNTSYCKQECQKKTYQLKDRLGYRFPLAIDSIDRITTIYNSKITSISPKDFSLSYARIDILDESIEEINQIIEIVKAGDRLEGSEYTNGNLYKEV